MAMSCRKRSTKRTARSSTDNKLRLAGQPKIDFRRRPGRDGKGARSQGRLQIQRRFRGAADIRGRLFDDVELERLVAEVPDEEVEQSIDAARRAEPHLTRRAKRAPSRKMATRSRSISSARSAMRHFEGGTAEERRSRARHRASSFPASKPQLEGAVRPATTARST